MQHHKTNLGVKPIGGKSSLGESPIVEAEIAALKILGDELAAIGPINSNEAAEKFRAALVKHDRARAAIFKHPAKLAATFDELKMSH
jgi:hypothetical protein